MSNFGLTAASLFEILTPAWSSTSAIRLYTGILFFTLQNGALSFFFKNFFVLLYFIYLFFCFFIKNLLPLLIFPMSKDFFHKLRASTFEFCQVSDVNSY